VKICTSTTPQPGISEAKLIKKRQTKQKLPRGGMFVFLAQSTNGDEKSKEKVLFTVLFISYFLP